MYIGNGMIVHAANPGTGVHGHQPALDAVRRRGPPWLTPATRSKAGRPRLVGGRPFAVPAARGRAAGLGRRSTTTRTSPRRRARRARERPARRSRAEALGRLRAGRRAAATRTPPARSPRRATPARRPAGRGRRQRRAPRRARLHAALRRRRGGADRRRRLDGRGRRDLARSPASTAAPAHAEVTRPASATTATGSRSPASAAATGVSPLWLSGPVEVRRTARHAGAGRRRGARRGRRRRTPPGRAAAVPVVRRVLPRLAAAAWSSRCRRSVDRRSTRALGADAGDVRPDRGGDDLRRRRRSRPDAPVHVFVNPEVFGGLRPDRRAGRDEPRGHPRRHRRLARSTMPLWLLEGFADYVALRDVDLPLSTTAGADHRRGAPRRAAAARCPARPSSTPRRRTWARRTRAPGWPAGCSPTRAASGALVRFYRAVDAGTPGRRGAARVVRAGPAGLHRRGGGPGSREAWRPVSDRAAGPPRRAGRDRRSAALASWCSRPGWCRGTRCRAARRPRSPAGVGLHAPRRSRRAEDYSALGAGLELELARRLAARRLRARLQPLGPAAGRPAARARGGCGWCCGRRCSS